MWQDYHTEIQRTWPKGVSGVMFTDSTARLNTMSDIAQGLHDQE